MEKNIIIGRWFSEQKELETDGETSTETRTLNVTEYLKNGALNSEGHCVVKTLSDGDKNELFIKFHISGTWQLDGDSLFEKVDHINGHVEEVFYNDQLITTDEIRNDLKSKMDAFFPIGTTVEMKIISCTDQKIVYEQKNDEGETNIRTMIKTTKSYSKYFS